MSTEKAEAKKPEKTEAKAFVPAAFPCWIYPVGGAVSAGVLISSAEEMPPGEWTDVATKNDTDDFAPGAKRVSEKDRRIAELEAQLAAKG